MFKFLWPPRLAPYLLHHTNRGGGISASGRDRVTMGGGRGEVFDKIGRRAHLSRRPSPKLLSRFGASFLKVQEAPSKKNEADSKTANLILGETKG